MVDVVDVVDMVDVVDVVVSGLSIITWRPGNVDETQMGLNYNPGDQREQVWTEQEINRHMRRCDD